MSDVTRLIDAAAAGDPKAAAELLPLVYDELRKLAASRLAEEKPGQTLQPTALVHEAYVRLVGGEQPQDWNGKAHFFAAAAEAMRRILIEAARRKARLRHGGERQRLELDAAYLPIEMPADHLLTLDEALCRLAERDPQAARLVNLHCFAGLSIEAAAAILDVSPRTAYRDWAFAQAWLYREIRGAEPPSDK
jgi:RNA polymerase sigma factor (TIGR02999 family)